MELSIVIAVFNEEAVLAELERRLTAALQKIGRSYEIVLIDDGSRDRSLEILIGLRARDPEHIHVLSFTRNFGHHIALTAGLDAAQGDVIVLMDADLQDQPEEIPKLLRKLDEGYDVVWGERETRQFRWYKNFTSWLFLWLMNSVARSEVPLDSSIFRAMRREVADDLRGLREKARYLPGLVRWLGYKQTSVPVEHGKRFAGETKYSFWRLIKLALSTATSFSAAPLQLATVTGMGIAALSVIAVLYILIRKLLGAYPVPGYASVMVAIFFFAALQLIVIGLMGEYISRIYREVQGRPLYLLRDLSGIAGIGDRGLGSEVQGQKPGARGQEATRLSELSESERNVLVAIIAEDTHLPLARVFGTPDQMALARYHFEAWRKSDPFVFLEKDGDRIAALSLLTELEWDTRVLGVPSARVLYANAVGGAVDSRRITNLRAVARRMTTFTIGRGIKLLDARISNEDLFLMRALEAEGLHTVDTLVTLGATHEKLERILQNAPFERRDDCWDFGSGLTIRPMQKSDEAVLARISYDSYGDHTMIQDRFFLEPSIPASRAQDVFHEWFLNLAKRHDAGEAIVLTAEIAGNVAGYIALEPMAEFAGAVWWKDSLNAVAPEARGRGVYRASVLAALDFAKLRDVSGLITKTQSSTYRVINTWLHLGGDILESAATLHWTN